MNETTWIEVDEREAVIADKDLDGEELLDWFLDTTTFHFRDKQATLREIVVHTVKGMIQADAQRTINKLEELASKHVNTSPTGPTGPPATSKPPTLPDALLARMDPDECEAFREGWRDRGEGAPDPGARGKYVDPVLSRCYAAGWHEANRRGTPFPYSGTTCSVCGRSQYVTTSGLTCDEGHGGADPAEDHEVCSNCEIPLGWKPSIKERCPRCGAYPINKKEE